VGIVLGIVLTGSVVMAGEHGKSDGKTKKAIVLANFGTTYPSAVKSLANIEKKVEEAFPGVEVRFAFTSNIIRNIWRERAANHDYVEKHPELKKFLGVKTLLATIADLQNEGCKTVIVQPSHVFAGEEFADTASLVAALNSIKTIKAKYMPFQKLVLGRPALGRSGVENDYHEDLIKGAEAVKSDVERAKKEGAALVYMGHGNEFYSTGIYAEFQQTLRKMYPDTKIFVGTVEGFPSESDVIKALQKEKPAKVLLKPMMVVAGDHANNDMAGDEPDSWKSKIKALAITVGPVLEGLRSNDKWADIYLEHIRDAAKDNGIDL
jgi:sirohydrochlorin cobaltochelatase